MNDSEWAYKLRCTCLIFTEPSNSMGLGMLDSVRYQLDNESICMFVINSYHVL